MLTIRSHGCGCAKSEDQAWINGADIAVLAHAWKACAPCSESVSKSAYSAYQGEIMNFKAIALHLLLTKRTKSSSPVRKPKLATRQVRS